MHRGFLLTSSVRCLDRAFSDRTKPTIIARPTVSPITSPKTKDIFFSKLKLSSSGFHLNFWQWLINLDKYFEGGIGRVMAIVCLPNFYFIISSETCNEKIGVSKGTFIYIYIYIYKKLVRINKGASPTFASLASILKYYFPHSIFYFYFYKLKKFKSIF